MPLVLVLVVALMPLLIAPGPFFYFDSTPKIAMLLFGVSLILLFIRGAARNIQVLAAEPAGCRYAWLVLAFWCSLSVSTLCSRDVLLSTFGSTWRGQGIIVSSAILLFSVLLTGWLRADRRNEVTILWAIAVSGVVGSLYGVSQYLGWDPLLPRQAYLAGEGPFTIVRPPGPLGHADYFAAWLIIVLFCDLALAGRESVPWRRWCALVGAGLAGLAVLLSGTRAGLLGAAAGLLYLGVQHRQRWSRGLVIAILVTTVAIVVLFVSAAGAPLRARAHWSREDWAGGARLLLWRDSLALVRQHPLVGFGPEVFVTVFPSVQSLELARRYPDFYHESPHNMVIDTAISQGIPGALILLALCGLGLVAGRSQALKAGLIAALVCHQFMVFLPATALSFFVLLSLIVGTAGERTGETESGQQVPWRLVPVTALAVGVFVVVAVRLVWADHALARVQKALDAGQIAVAVANYQTVLRWQLPGHSSDLFYSRRMASLAAGMSEGPERNMAWQESLTAAARATQSAEDRQNAWYSLAMLHAAQNDAAGVERSLRMASLSAPAWFKPHWALARYLEMTNRHGEALREAAAAIERDGAKDAEVIDTWRRLNESRR